MYKVVATQGLVLTKRSAGEANTLVAILTKDLGVVRAAARSARVEQSKLRYGLEPLTQGKFSMVRGRHEWKLVGTEELSRAYLAGSPLSRRAAGRVTRLLLRLIHGEDPVVDVYTTVVDGLDRLARAESEAEMDSVECVLVLRVLAHLGYLPHTPALAPFLQTAPQGDFMSEDLAVAVARSRPALIRTINNSLSATGL